MVVTATEYVCKSEEHEIVPIVITGNAPTLIAKLTGVPGQVPICGVTVIVATCEVAKLARVLKAIFPEPVAAIPILILPFVQLNVAPLLPAKLIATGCPAHTDTSAGVVMVGEAFTVKVTGVLVVLTQPVAGSLVSAKNI